MNRFQFIIILSCLIGPLPAAADTQESGTLSPAAPQASEMFAGSPEVIMSLDDCISTALSQSPTIRIADLELTRYDYSRKETLAALLPKIDFALSYQRSIELQTMRMDMGGQSQQIKMGSDNTWNTGFTASLPLVAPTLWKSLSLSSTQILQAAESARTSRLQTVNAVSQAYYSLMLALASRDVIRQNYETALLNAQLYEKRFSQGTASEYDVLRANVQVTNLEPDLLQAEIAINRCKLQLCVLLGLDVNVNITPDTTLEAMETLMRPASGETYPLDANPSLRSLDLQRRLAADNTSLRKMAFLPTLGASFNINWLALSNDSPFKNQQFSPYSSVGLQLQVPIFSGGSRWYALKQAKVQQTELDLQREDLVNSLRMQVDIAVEDIDRQARQVVSSRRGVDQARKARSIMQKSFEIGAATYLELRDSEVAEMSARLVYLQAIHSWLSASSELDLLLGREHPAIK
ncbi:MAG: TolC family protein [Muribaculaceae bacterium]|nr:TolC family protein [Muribaculaceae bacterium]